MKSRNLIGIKHRLAKLAQDVAQVLFFITVNCYENDPVHFLGSGKLVWQNSAVTRHWFDRTQPHPTDRIIENEKIFVLVFVEGINQRLQNKRKIRNKFCARLFFQSCKRTET